jgi:hypothetical protein
MNQTLAKYTIFASAIPYVALLFFVPIIILIIQMSSLLVSLSSCESIRGNGMHAYTHMQSKSHEGHNMLMTVSGERILYPLLSS